MEPSQLKDHEDHIGGKGYTSLQHYTVVHKFIPVPRSMKIPDAEASVDKERKKEARNKPSMATGESQEQERSYSRSTKRHKESPLCYIDGHMSPQKRAVRTQITEV